MASDREYPARVLKPVRELPPEVARKIAAGEVIDRPAAVVRELLDNSIDAGATKITVEISGGGVESIRVTDNGSGMTAEDLALCTHTHTTSKISAEDDLLTLATLGFRGEALSSIHTVSRLEITTTRNGREAWKLELGKVIPARLSAGTIVRIDGLFENFPARRQFLKRASAETSLCRQIFTEKALAWPNIEFRFTVDGVQRMILGRSDTLRERALAALEPKEGEGFFYEIASAGEGFRFSAVLGSPDVVRSDRKQLMVFINGRRIMEYALLQAIEYGAQGHFPNGGHPFGCLFITIDPSLVDFNIHPAKREARFRDAAPLHHAVSSVIRDFFRRYSIAELHRGNAPEFPGFPESAALAAEAGSAGASSGGQEYRGYRTEQDSRTEVRYRETAYRDQEYRQRSADSPQAETDTDRASHPTTVGTPAEFKYLGQVLGTFLAVEKNNLFYLIDQHAAHERILYDELFGRTGEMQELLIPYRIETASDSEDRYLAGNRAALAAAGFVLEDEGDGIWQVTAVPVRWTGSSKDLSEELLDTSIEPAALVSHIYATAACRAACKDGDVLDPLTARNLAERAFAIAEPVCPHGRPLWIIMDRGELFRRIGRT